MDLSSFGHRLRHLRTTAGLTQSALADQIGVATDLIWKWEKGYQHRGRQWIPDRDLVLQLIRVFAVRFTPGEAQQWAEQAGHHLSQADLQAIFPTHWAQAPMQLPPLPAFHIARTQVEQIILNQLNQSKTLTLVGPGGIGKTVLAARIARMLVNQFPDGVIWVESPASNNVIEAQNWVARSFGVTLNDHSPAERAATLRTLLHDRECLLILDDVWADPQLLHLQVVNQQSCLLLTTRDAKVADLLNSPRLEISGLTSGEGLALLSAWVGHSIGAEELVARLGGLPLALSLSGAQLRAGTITLEELLAYFDHAQVDLSLLDLDDPQSRQESLNLCFDLSYRQLKPKEQQWFAQLGCFAGNLEEAAVAVVWNITPSEAARILRRLRRFALLEQGEREYRLHPLLRDFAWRKLSTWPDLERRTRHGHAVWYIHFALYHPGVLSEASRPAPLFAERWSNIFSAINWATVCEPKLAAWAFLLAHGERPALLEIIGNPLKKALECSILEASEQAEEALFTERLAETHLWYGQMDEAITAFSTTAEIWQAANELLAAAMARLRQAGVSLLQNKPTAAVVAGQQAQVLIRAAYPIPQSEYDDLSTTFYWLKMVYGSLVRWSDCPEIEAIEVAKLAQESGYPQIEAVGLDVYQRWWTVEELNRVQTKTDRAQVVNIAMQIYKLWKSVGNYEEAEKGIIWANYFLKGRFTRRTAVRYAQRLSRKAPVVTSDLIRMTKDEGVRWWLGASEAQRVGWLSRMMPRYLGAIDCGGKKLHPESRAWLWIESIQGVTILGSTVRRPKLAAKPTIEILTVANMAMFGGYKAFPVIGKMARHRIQQYLEELVTVLT